MASKTTGVVTEKTEGTQDTRQKESKKATRKKAVSAEDTAASEQPVKQKKVANKAEPDAMADASMEKAIESIEIEESRIITEDDVKAEYTRMEGAAADGDDKSSLDEVVRNTAFTYPTVAKASKAMREELYAKDRGLRREGIEQKTLSEGAIRHLDYLDLSQAANGHRILTGEVVGICNADTNGNENASTVMAEISYGHDVFSIYIPSYLFFDYEMKKYEDANAKEEIKTMMAKYIGADIQFCVAYVDEKNGIAYADRLKACAMRSVRYYKMPQNLNEKDGLPKFFAGCIAEGTVIYTSRQSIVVDVGGADVRISVGELDYSYIRDARELYHVGQAIRIKILEVAEKSVKKFSNKYTLFNVVGSIKQLKRDTRAEIFAQFKEGGIYKGTIMDNIETGVFVKLKNKYDCLVAPPKFGPIPVVGTSRQVRVTRMEQDTLRIFGTFISQ